MAYLNTFNIHFRSSKHFITLSIALCIYALLNGLPSAGRDHTAITRPVPNETVDMVCSPDMYGNDTAAFWACRTQFAHQANWWPSPIAGLFSYQVWNGYDGFWQDGAVLETFTNFIKYTGGTHKRYVNVIKGSERDLYSLLEAYGPYPSFDDMGWYGLSYTKIHEVFGDQIFLSNAVEIYNWIWSMGWDKSGTCDGGFWFDTTMVSKQTITNAQMLQLSARLFKITNDTKYEKNMNQLFNYIMHNGLINTTTYLVSDGATFNCTPADLYGPTYNSGVMIGALTEMYMVTNKTQLLDLAFKIANAIFEHRCNENGILVEYCHPDCDEDALMYKGLFARNLRYFIDVLDDLIKKEYLVTWLNLQIESNIKYNLCDVEHFSKCNVTFKDGPPFYNTSGPVFSPDWRGPFTYGSPIPQTSVLDLLVAAIRPGTRCEGKYCNYDPYFPPPTSLTCQDQPCPEDEDCCEYSPYSSYTCCYTNQHCNKTTGICDDNNTMYYVP